MFNNELNVQFNFVKSKLFGYTEINTKILDNYLIDEYAKYGKAIMLSNQGKLLESLKLYLSNPIFVSKLDCSKVLFLIL